MRDVAALARVSLKTASRVINGDPTVGADLADRVHRAAAALEYRPNLAARSLRRRDGRTRTIGLVLENVANPFSAALHRAVEDVASARGVAVLAGSVDENPRRERELVLALVARRADGLIIAPSGDDQSYLAIEQRSGVSIVFVDRRPQLLRSDTVLSDNVAGARSAVEHLVAVGHRRIAFLGDLRRISTAVERFNGYAEALKEAEIPMDEELVRFDLHDARAAEAAVRSLLTGPRPSALFTTQNLITEGALRALRALGMSKTVALVGFDDIVLADLLEPAVTVVAQDPVAMGTTACRLLFGRMDGDTSPPREHFVPTTLVIRGSGEIPPPSAQRNVLGGRSKLAPRN
jgi:LacI family transcriptional regulator